MVGVIVINIVCIICVFWVFFDATSKEGANKSLI